MELVTALLHYAQVLIRDASTRGLAEASGVLRAILLGVDSRNLKAWELLAFVVSRQALAAYDGLVEVGVLATEGSELPARLLSAARSLNRAAQLCENYFQALWYSHAQATGQAAVEVDFKELRPPFAQTMQAYGVVQDALDALTYASDTRGSRERPVEGPTVVLVVVVVGTWADVGVVTLWSLLRQRTVPLRIFALGDAVGLRDWRRVVGELHREAGAALWGVRFEHVDVFIHPRMQWYLQQLPKGCASSNMSVALFARLICHELLPNDVPRAIAMDLGDVLVFGDILGLWREGDLLQPNELLAAASHRAVEETWRRGKPSMLNGGVVLYELSRMRASNYTQDSLEAARIGLRKKYSHFCQWDQDIINVMHAELWQGQRVRVLPCRWSLFPVTGWQFFWNTPSFWPRELFERRRYPGLLTAEHVEHFCPAELELLLSVFAFEDEGHRNLARDVALYQGSKTRESNAALRAPDGSLCGCGERASLLHVPSTMKLWPWAQRLFEHHAPPLSRKAARGAFFLGRKEQKPESLGGGFWGAENEADLAAADTHALQWAKEHGSTISVGECAALRSDPFSYARVDFRPGARQREEELVLVVETSAREGGRIFIGNLSAEAEKIGNLGLEISLGSKCVLSFGVQGKELASYNGLVFGSGRWSSFWIRVRSSGSVLVGAGKSAEASVMMRALVNLPASNSLVNSHVYVGSWSAEPEQWLLCHA